MTEKTKHPVDMICPVCDSTKLKVMTGANTYGMTVIPVEYFVCNDCTLKFHSPEQLIQIDEAINDIEEYLNE